MSNLPTNLDEAIEQLGNICHQSYTGCVKDTDDWEYCYKNEVINLLDTPEARKVIHDYCQSICLSLIEEHSYYSPNEGNKITDYYALTQSLKEKIG